RCKLTRTKQNKTKQNKGSKSSQNKQKTTVRNRNRLQEINNCTGACSPLSSALAVFVHFQVVREIRDVHANRFRFLQVRTEVHLSLGNNPIHTLINEHSVRCGRFYFSPCQ